MMLVPYLGSGSTMMMMMMDTTLKISKEGAEEAEEGGRTTLTVIQVSWLIGWAKIFLRQYNQANLV